MIHITCITVGTLKESYLVEAVKEYEKRLGAYAKVEDVSLKEEKINDEDDPNAVRAALEAEGDAILRAIPKDSYKIALCVEGKQFDSPALAERIREATATSGKLTLVIGSSHGLAPKVKEAADLRLSISKLTFPHQLMRVMIFEILYRSMTILAGKKYHK